jgi:hypothetical protein
MVLDGDNQLRGLTELMLVLEHVTAEVAGIEGWANGDRNTMQKRKPKSSQHTLDRRKLCRICLAQFAFAMDIQQVYDS